MCVKFSVPYDRCAPSNSAAKIKPLIRHDRRYENVRHYEDREALFRKYIATLKSATAAYVAHENLSIRRTHLSGRRREREREVEIRRERDHREAKRMLSEVQREENVNDLRSLFSECIKHPSMTWEEAQVLLKNRERFQSSQLSIRDKEELFHGHIKELLTVRCSWSPIMCTVHRAPCTGLLSILTVGIAPRRGVPWLVNGVGWQNRAHY